MLQFFGFDILAEKKYFKNRKEYLGRMKESKVKVCFMSYKYTLCIRMAWKIIKMVCKESTLLHL